MPYRTFIDSDGNDWQVWDIIPRLSEQRASENDRRMRPVQITFGDRRTQTRRLVQSRRAYLSGSYAQGWLCFDSVAEKRRLSPIPHDWLTCEDDILRAHLGRAERVSAVHRFGHDDDARLAQAS